ncbi:hypothetical protein ACEK07_45960 [Alcanivoracaceae bacterium MT1]
MSPNTSFKKGCERRRIAADVERFLAQGGQIREFGPECHKANRTAHEIHRQRVGKAS